MPALWKEPSVRENGKLNKFIGEAYSSKGVSRDYWIVDTLPSLASVTVRVQIH